MDNLPNGWTACDLGSLLISLESGSRPKGGVKDIKEGIPSIGGEHLTYKGTFNFSSVKYVPQEFASRMHRGHIQKNDILIVKDGATTGKTAFVDEKFPFKNAVVNEHVFVCRPSQLVESRYLFRYLMSQKGQERILDNFQGSAQGGINLSFAPNVQVPLAPPSEQRRIVVKLEKLLAKAEACQERLNKIPALLKRFRQSVLAAACSGRITADWREAHIEEKPDKDSDILENGLPEIPETWRWIKLPKTGEMSRGKSRHRPRNAPFLFGGSYPFIQTGDIAQSAGRITNHKQTYSEVGLAQSRLWSAKTVCITIAANIAASALLTYPACFPDSVVGIIADRSICIPEFLEFFIRTAKSHLSTFAPATAQKNINIRILSDVLVPLPPLSEQTEIVRRVEALFKIADQIEARYQKAKAHIEKLTQSIFAKAFCGELVPQDPSDEPASALLECIRQERKTR